MSVYRLLEVWCKAAVVAVVLVDWLVCGGMEHAVEDAA
jgi:hypothetical protein